MRNQLMAAVLERRADLDRVELALLLHDDNLAVRTLKVRLAGSAPMVCDCRTGEGEGTGRDRRVRGEAAGWA